MKRTIELEIQIESTGVQDSVYCTDAWDVGLSIRINQWTCKGYGTVHACANGIEPPEWMGVEWIDKDLKTELGGYLYRLLFDEMVQVACTAVANKC